MFLLIMLKPALSSPVAQLNPTQQQQTINAIINPRLTLTAAAIKVGTPTAVPPTSIGPTRGNTSVVPTGTPTATPTQSLTPSQVSETDQARTIIAVVQQRLTLTAQQQVYLTKTAGFLQTVNSVLNQTLGVTPTVTLTATVPTAAPNAATPDDPTLQAQTLDAVINSRLTQTSQGQLGQTSTAIMQTAVSQGLNFRLTATGEAIRSTLVAGL